MEEEKIIEFKNEKILNTKEESNNSKAMPVIPNMRANHNLYVPSNLYNQNYQYWLTNNTSTLVVRTNDNCYTNLNNQYCDCYEVYIERNYLISMPYSCRTSTSNSQISYNDLNSFWYYREDIPLIIITVFVLLLVCFYFPYKLISRIFGRWLKI